MSVGKTTKHRALPTVLLLLSKERGEQERQTIVQRKECKSARREVNAEVGLEKVKAKDNKIVKYRKVISAP